MEEYLKYLASSLEKIEEKQFCCCFILKSEDEIVTREVWHDEDQQEIKCPQHKNLSSKENIQMAPPTPGCHVFKGQQPFDSVLRSSGRTSCQVPERPTYSNPSSMKCNVDLFMRSEDKLESRDIQSLPKCFHLRKSSITANEYGVWSYMEVEKGIRFGPYEGITVNEDEADQSRYIWKVLKEKDICYSEDGEGEHESNWLHFVNFAPHQGQQNLVALQYNGQIYYETIKDISPDKELLVWCGDDDAAVGGNETEKKKYTNEVSSSRIGHRNEKLCLTINSSEKRFTNNANLTSDKNNDVYGHLCQNTFTSSSNEKVHQSNCAEEEPHPYKNYKQKCCYNSSVNNHFEVYAYEKPHLCNICKKIFNTNDDSNAHQRIHAGEKTFKCDICKKEFNQNYKLKKHQRIHTAEKLFSCNICKKRFIANAHLTHHQRIHTGEKPFICDICKKEFNENCNLKSHRRIHTGEKPFTCDICDKKFNENGNLKIHQRIHTGEKPFSCNICRKRFNTSGNLNVHQKKHRDEKPFSCNFCKKRFIANAHLTCHQRIHTGEKPFKCDICDKKFNINGNLKIHQKIHTGEKTFTCDICDKKFKINGYLKIHRRIHTGEKTFKCDICQKKFNRNGNLKIHQRIHTGEKPFKCDICQMKFNGNGNLKIHQRIHTGEKPFTCDICKKKFTRNHYLKNHQITHTR